MSLFINLLWRICGHQMVYNMFLVDYTAHYEKGTIKPHYLQILTLWVTYIYTDKGESSSEQRYSN